MDKVDNIITDINKAIFENGISAKEMLHIGIEILANSIISMAMEAQNEIHGDK